MLQIDSKCLSSIECDLVFAFAVICSGACCLFGSTVNAQFVLSKKNYGDWFSLSLGWAFALVIAIQTGFHISGSHLNPAVSFFLFTFGQLSFRRLLLYSLAQITGAYVGSFITFLVYYDAINAYDDGVRFVDGPLATSAIFFPNPQKYLSISGAIIDQVTATALMCFCIAMITNRRSSIPVSLQPILLGMSLGLIGLCMGMNAGYEINPARDLGPKLFALSAGYGWEVFSYNDYTWFWIPIVFPYVGAVIGSWAYQFCIGFHLQCDDEDGSNCERCKKEMFLTKTYGDGVFDRPQPNVLQIAIKELTTADKSVR